MLASYQELLGKRTAPSDAEIRGWVLSTVDLRTIREQFKGSTEFYASGSATA